MGGKPARINIEDLLGLDLTQWHIAIATPGLKISNQLREIKNLELRDGQGLLLEPISLGARSLTMTSRENFLRVLNQQGGNSTRRIDPPSNYTI